MSTYGPQTYAADSLHAMKYRSPGESFREAMNRVAFGLKDSDAHYHALRNILLEQRFCPGGRIQGNIGSSKATTSMNCYVSGTIGDSFVEGADSIMERAKEAAATMRMGGGIGYNFSTLRPKGDLIVALQSQSSGPIPFMQIFNAVCLATSSSGHRRGAQMAVLRVDHPNIEEFIRAKQDNTSLRGFNLSIGITDAFMHAVETQSQFNLTFNGRVYQTVNAAELWEKIMRSTWDFAEPGVIFLDTINRMNNLWYCETISATNPCFTGDTLVWTAYGPKSFSELAQNGATIPVLTQLSDGTLAYRDMKNPRKTAEKQPLVEVTIRGSRRKAGSITKIRCTPEHKFFLTNGQIKMAKHLSFDDRIYSAYRYQANSKGYVKIAGKYEEIMEHHVATEYQCGRRPNYPEEHAHHRDDDKTNNRPDNMEIKLGAVHNSENMALKNAQGLMLHDTYTGNPGEANGRWRDDIWDWELKQLRQRGMSYKAIADHVGCSKYTVMKRLGWERPSANHTVVSVKHLTYYEDVYCGTVDATSRFFIYTGENEGVLVSNCGEQPLPPFGACLLGSFNLVKYLIPLPINSSCQTNLYDIDYDRLKADIPVVVRGMDNVIDRTRYPLERQKEEAFAKRRMGLGVMGLANAIEACGPAYGSKEFLELEEDILYNIQDLCYRASIELAKEKGYFPLFKAEEYLAGEHIKRLPLHLRKAIAEHGIRNSHLTSIAPTGTISMCADNVSGGIEPVFAYKLQRQIHTPDGPKLVAVEDYGAKFLGVKGKLAADVTAQEHLNVLATAQRYTDSAVSKTINVTSAMPWEDFKQIYFKAWKLGCKGCTTFNIDGKREALLVVSETPGDENPEVLCSIPDPATGQVECG